jgi:hypothetical protein
MRSVRLLGGIAVVAAAAFAAGWVASRWLIENFGHE